MITCPIDWGTHGCHLAPGHEGDHLCLLLDRDDPRWVWVDAGSWCNFWGGKEVGFFYYVCDRRGDQRM